MHCDQMCEISKYLVDGYKKYSSINIRMQRVKYMRNIILESQELPLFKIKVSQKVTILNTAL